MPGTAPPIPSAPARTAGSAKTGKGKEQMKKVHDNATSARYVSFYAPVLVLITLIADYTRLITSRSIQSCVTKSQQRSSILCTAGYRYRSEKYVISDTSDQPHAHMLSSTRSGTRSQLKLLRRRRRQKLRRRRKACRRAGWSGTLL